MLQERWPDAHFAVKSFPHDFGTYREVLVYYDTEENDPIAHEVEANLPKTWDKKPAPVR